MRRKRGYWAWPLSESSFERQTVIRHRTLRFKRALPDAIDELCQKEIQVKLAWAKPDLIENARISSL